MSFDRAFEITIGHEGGYVDDPDDPGGETNFGISKRAYPDVDIKGLTIEKAKEIYKRDYWDRMRCDEFDSDVGIELFDTSVNMGVGKAAKIFQEALNLLNRNQTRYKNISVDGGIGANTVAAYGLAKRDKRILFNVMNILQGEHYIELMRRNETFEKYIGWFERVEIKKK